MNELPETILQFGAGNFLRSFADLFIHQANQDGQAVGRIVVVQSTGRERAEAINAQSGRYHVVIRGFAEGQVVERVEEAGAISRALFAGDQWDAILEVARSPQLRWILSNTTEAGYDLDPGDGPDADPPPSFPAKLTAVLHTRWRAGGDPVVLLPCELFEGNADRLRSLVLGLARDWGLDESFCEWVAESCRWRNTLVDRIVTGRPAEHPLLDRDALLTVGEPYALWAVQRPEGDPTLFEHPALLEVPDVTPYFLRKVRILNGAHTALVCKARPMGLSTVRESVEHPEVGPWLHGLLFEEIVPVLEGRVDDAERFAHQTLDRFRNPFLEHKLETIALHHEAKVQTRLVPTFEEFRAQKGRTPERLAEILVGPYLDE